MISFVRPAGISNFDVRISNSKTYIYRGCCYYNGAYYHATANPFIIVRVTRNENYFQDIQHTKEEKDTLTIYY